MRARPCIVLRSSLVAEPRSQVQPQETAAGAHSRVTLAVSMRGYDLTERGQRRGGRLAAQSRTALSPDGTAHRALADVVGAAARRRGLPARVVAGPMMPLSQGRAVPRAVPRRESGGWVAGRPNQSGARARSRPTGTYRHTEAELTFAAQVAWRNSSRCIGRLYWRSLRVRDRRHLSSAADDRRRSALRHLRAATNGGRIRPLITVFAPDAPGRPGPRILSSQLVRYAGLRARRRRPSPATRPVSTLTRLARAARLAAGRAARPV